MHYFTTYPHNISYFGEELPFGDINTQSKMTANDLETKSLMVFRSETPATQGQDNNSLRHN